MAGLLSQLYLASINRLYHSIVVPICINSIIFTIIFISLYATLSSVLYFTLISMLIFILGYTSVFLSAGTFELAASLNSAKYASLIMIGQGLAGIISSILSYYLNYEIDESESEFDISSCDIHIIGNGPSWYFGVVTFLLLISVLLSLAVKKKAQYQSISDSTTINTKNSNDNIESSSASPEIEKSTMITTSVELLPFTIPIALIFIVTLSVFPGLTSMIQSCSKHNNNKYVSLLFFMYNITDTIGKYLSYYFQEYNEYILYTIQLISVVRLALIPIFLSFQNVLTSTSTTTSNCNECSSCINIYPVIAISILGLR